MREINIKSAKFYTYLHKYYTCCITAILEERRNFNNCDEKSATVCAVKICLFKCLLKKNN